MVHVPFGVTSYGLSFEFELDDGDRFVHLRHQLGRTRQTRVVIEIFRLPDCAGVIAIDGHGEVRQGEQVDAVALFERLDVRITDTHAQHGSQERHVTRHGTHPFYIVVAPLDVVVADGGEHV